MPRAKKLDWFLDGRNAPSLLREQYYESSEHGWNGLEDRGIKLDILVAGVNKI